MKIAIIGAGAVAKNVAIRAKELNIETHCFAWAKGAVAKDDVDFFHDISIFEKETITNICRDLNISGVIATTELTISIAAYIANELKLNNNPPELAAVITNKSWVRSKMVGLKTMMHPEFTFVKTGEAIPEIQKFPVIVKPTSTGGKRGITVVYKKEDLAKALSEAQEFVRNESEGILIEQFLDKGQEYSVESLSFHRKHYIIQATEKDSSGAPHCVELGHHQPAPLTPAMRQKVVAAVTELLDCLGIQNGPCHTEIKIIDNDVYLIELKARPGGDHISYPLTELSSGYKYITGIILCACDIFYDPEVYKGPEKYAGICFVSKQTAHLKELFDHCETEPWCYKKNLVSDDLQEIIHNDGLNTNYFIYCSDKKPELPAKK